MTSPLRAIKLVCIILSIIFAGAAFFIFLGFLPSSLLLPFILLGIPVAFISVSVAISKIIQEFESAMFANAEEINALKKEISDLQKQIREKDSNLP